MMTKNLIIKIIIIIVSKNIKIADFIQIENMINNIHKIVKETYSNLKDKPNKNIEEQYGSLNINAQTYIPKKKILNDNNITNNNINYAPTGPAILNNNMPQQMHNHGRRIFQN